MSKIKAALLFIVLIFLGILFYENEAYFLYYQQLKLISYQLPAVPNGILFLICLFAGIIGTWMSVFSKNIGLRKEAKACRTKLSQMTDELDVLKAKMTSGENKTGDTSLLVASE